MSDVIWAPAARKDLTRFGSDTADRIESAVHRLSTTREGDLQKLRGDRENRWRLRVGDYRVILRFERDLISVLRIFSRQSAYRD